MSDAPDVKEEVRIRLQREDEFSQADIAECENLLDAHYEDILFPDEKVRLSELTAENFKVLEETSISFDGTSSILTGLNSAGKTSLLTAIQFNLLGIPDSDSERTDYGMTGLIKKDAQTLRTEGKWSIGDDDYLIQRFLQREGRGGAYTRYDEPRVTERPVEGEIQYDQRDTQSDVSELAGFDPLERRGYSRFGIASLFFVMSKDFRLFMDWNQQSDMIDMLFGLNLTQVINGIDAKIGDEYKIEPEDEQVPQELATLQSNKQDIGEKLSKLRQEKEQLQAQLSDKRDQLESVMEVLEGEDRLQKLKSRKGELENRLIDLKNTRQEIQNKARQTQIEINRYQDAELRDDLSSIADELRDLMTVPDRCPVCTKDVDREQRQSLVEHHQCPLCSKEMPEDRIRVEREHQVPRSLASVEYERREELEELENKLAELADSEEVLTGRIGNLNAELEAVKEQIESSDLTEYVKQQETLQRDVKNLRDEAVSLETAIVSREQRLTEINDQVKLLQDEHEELKAKRDKQSVLKQFKRIVREVRDLERDGVKNQLEEEMNILLSYFTDGLFAPASHVEFTDGSNYQFTVYTREGRQFRSHISDQNTAEVVLHTLLFHTALLKQLSKKDESLPFRLFVIDAPFANEMDIGNAPDITSFLTQLPEILDDYQVLVSVAETESFDEDDYTLYDIKRLNSS